MPADRRKGHELRGTRIEDMFGCMTDPVQTNPEKDPDDWATGDEPMTGPQHSYLSTLAHEAGAEPPADDLTKGRRFQAHRRAAGAHRAERRPVTHRPTNETGR